MALGGFLVLVESHHVDRAHLLDAPTKSAAGLFFGVGDLATKGAVSGNGLLFAPLLTACTALGFVTLQLAFQRGRVLETAGLSVLVNNMIPIAGGLLLFHEGLPGGAAGVARVAIGKVEYGQGIWTALAQVAAEELQIDLARVRMAPVSTSTAAESSVWNLRAPAQRPWRTAWLRALRASGRSMVSHATPSSTSGNRSARAPASERRRSTNDPIVSGAVPATCSLVTRSIASPPPCIVTLRATGRPGS